MGYKHLPKGRLSKSAAQLVIAEAIEIHGAGFDLKHI
jgi:hypothetical protein